MKLQRKLTNIGVWILSFYATGTAQYKNMLYCFDIAVERKLFIMANSS